MFAITCVAAACANTLGSDGDEDGGGGEDGGSNDPCAKFRDASPEQVTVRFINARDITIYIGGRSDDCVERPDFDVAKDGATLDLDPMQKCTPTCGGYQEAPVSCSGGCPDDPMIRIEPGSSWDFAWEPVHYKFGEMPLDCYDDAQPVDSQGFCETKTELSSADYDVVGYYYFDTIVKAPGAGSMEYGCPCADGSSSSVCEAVAGCEATSSPANTAGLSFSFPVSDVVEVVIQ